MARGFLLSTPVPAPKWSDTGEWGRAYAERSAARQGAAGGSDAPNQSPVLRNPNPDARRWMSGHEGWTSELTGNPRTISRLPQDAPPPSASPVPQNAARVSADGAPADHGLGIYARRGAAYAQSQIASHSYYSSPIAHLPGEPGGKSRRAGDASREVQAAAMSAIVSAGQAAGMTDRQIALTLAIARHESGFNPDAAAGTTSASGLGQFVNATATQYGLTRENRWNVDAQAAALVQHTRDNLARAVANGHTGAESERYAYAYHHDGPGLKYGGLGLSDRFVVPRIAVYQNYVRRLREIDE